MGHDAEYIESYVNQVDGYPRLNGQIALELAMQCIQGNGKSGPQPAHSRRSLVDRVCNVPIEPQSPGSGDAFSPAWRQPW